MLATTNRISVIFIIIIITMLLLLSCEMINGHETIIGAILSKIL